MTIGFDAATESVRTGTTDPYTFDHTPAGTPRGVVLIILQRTSDTDHVTSVTYGGVAMSRVITHVDTGGEPGRAYLYFLGSSVPTGTQTLSIDLSSSTTDDMHFVCITFTSAASDTSVVDSDGVSEDTTDARVTLNYAGRTCMAVAGIWSGLPSVGDLTPTADCTAIHDHDHGNQVSLVQRQTTPGSTDFQIGWTAGTSDDVAMVAAAISEALPSIQPPRTMHQARLRRAC